MILVEGIAGSADEALIAESAGVDRLEVCSALALGGLTPTVGVFSSIRAATRLPAVAMVRPRIGGFCYSDREFSSMLRDAELLLEAGVDGLVFAFLSESGEIDRARCQAMLDLVLPRQAVFHRAFDATSSALDSLETLIDLGFTRVLTSGHANTALEGASVLRALVEAARGRIEILAGGGIRPSTVREIVALSGVSQIHLGPVVPQVDPSLSGLSADLYGSTYPIADVKTLSEVVRLTRLQH